MSMSFQKLEIFCLPRYFNNGPDAGGAFQLENYGVPNEETEVAPRLVSSQQDRGRQQDGSNLCSTYRAISSFQAT